MKKIVTLAIFIVSILSADWVRVVGPSESPVPPEKTIIKLDTIGLILNMSVFGFTEQDTTVDNKTFKRVMISEELLQQMQCNDDTMMVGKPQVPYVRMLVAVPDSATFSITVYESDYTLFEGYVIYPIPNIVFEDSAGWIRSREVFSYDGTFYQKDTLYPGIFYEVKNDGHWRDQRVLELYLYPVQYNPNQKQMYFYSHIDVRIEYGGTVVENPHGLGPFEEIGRETLLGYPLVDPDFQPPPQPSPDVHYYTDLKDTNNVADYIIVTHEVFIQEGRVTAYWIDQFVEWRAEHNRFDVGIVKMQDIYTQFDSLAPDSAAQLKDFLCYAYDNWEARFMSDGHFAYCLFIGDWDYVPIETCLVKYSGTFPLTDDVWMNAYEGYFRKLTSDAFEDIMLGRWPAGMTEETGLIHMVQKTLHYEQSPVLGDWRRRGLLIGGPGPGYYSYVDNNINQAIPYFGNIYYDTLTLRAHRMAPRIAMDDSVHTHLERGEIIAAFYGHGGPYGWNVPDAGYGSYWYAETLKNADTLPVVLSYACNPAMFQFDHPYYDTLVDPERPDYWAYDTCFAECMLWNPNGGAVAFYGCTSPVYMSTYNTIPMKKTLLGQHWILGKALVDAYKRLADNSKVNCYCLLGDPALDLGDYTAYPDLPDLLVRAHGLDISVLPPYPYPSCGDTIPVQAKIWNIGGATAYNVDVNLKVRNEDEIENVGTVAIDEILPRDTATAIIYWSPEANCGEIGDCDFIITVDPDSMITESWEYNNTSSIKRKVVLYPPGWSKKIGIVFQPATANLDDTSSVEIVCPGVDSMYVFKADGSAFDGWPQYLRNVYGIVLANVNGDDYVDVVAVSPESIKVYNYQGNILWSIQHPDVANYWYTGLPAVGQVENCTSELLNIVVASLRKTVPCSLKVLVHDYNGNLVHEFATPFGLSEPHMYVTVNGAAVEDVTGSGNDEVIVSFCDEIGSRTEIFNSTGCINTLYYGGNKMTSSLVDLDDDNFAEMITGGKDKKIRAYKATTDTILWTTETGGEINSSPAVGDINPTGDFRGDEITFGNDAKQIWAIQASDGQLWNPWYLEVGGAVRTSPALAYIDTVAGLDIIIGSEDLYLHAFTYEGDTIFPFPLPFFGRLSSPLVGDIDGDGKSEIVLSSKDGYLHVRENLNSQVLAYTLEWPQFHHDYQRTGLYGWVRDISGGSADPRRLTTLSPQTTISLYVEEDSLFTLMNVYNSEGKKVRTLVNQTLAESVHTIIWDGKDDSFVVLPNGLYFIEIKVRNETKIIPVRIDW